LFILKHNLSVGDFFEYSGELIIMRDAAHNKIKQLFDDNSSLPIDFKDKIIFYAGPAKKPDNLVIGAIGPTTSSRMDNYLEIMYKLGIKATIGKGNRSSIVDLLNKKYNKYYFVCPSGAAATLAQKVFSYEVIAFPELGPEAIQKIVVVDFPLIVAIDNLGNNFYNL
jgi:fumarate hydratase subunit beta